MRVVSSLFLSLALVPGCVPQTPVTAQYENLPGVAIYSNGYLLSWDSPQYTQVTLYGRDAKPAFSAPERRDDSSSIMWAVDSDGVVVGAYMRNRLMEGRIDLLDSFGNVTHTINTGSYSSWSLLPTTRSGQVVTMRRTAALRISTFFTITLELAKNWDRRFPGLKFPAISDTP